MSATWKPCDRLTPEDFKKHAAWTYDLARAAKDEKSDESWVRPAKPGADHIDDELFVRATLLDREGKPVTGCVLTLRPAARKNGRPSITGLVVLKPYYDPTPIEEDRVGSTLSAAMQRRLPIVYDVDVKAGDQVLRTKGRLSPFTPEPRPIPIAAPSPVVPAPPPKRAATAKPPAPKKKAQPKQKAQPKKSTAAKKKPRS